MNLRVFLVVIFGLISLDSIAQRIFGDFYPYYNDELILNEYRDSLYNSGVNEIFVFQKNISKIIDSVQVCTYILWNENNHGYIKLITDSFIYKTAICNNLNIFKIPDLFSAAIIDKFDKPYNFVDPVVDFRNRFIIYSNKQFIFSFPSGDFGFQIVEDIKRHNKRKQIADLIESEISNCNFHHEKEKTYKRLVLFRDEDLEILNKVHDKYIKK